jgi:aryl-alcohol dehydrogenase-like predicted oxidoreductase
MPNQHHPRRREFLATVGAMPLAAADERRGGMIYRSLGRTGERVSALGLGGAHIGRPREEQIGISIVRTAIDRGVTFMDNGWSYMGGKCEVWMGRALRDGYRKKVFLMTKFDGRTKAAAARQIEESLRRLETDVIDLMQYHENIRMDDPDRFFAPNGPLEALLDARKAGKIRYIGFTGHKDPAMHLRMLELAAKNKFRFDAAQMPLNVLDASFRSFAQQVLPKLVAQGIAALGMKPLASGAIPQSHVATATECLHYALSLPTSVVITGCDSPQRLDQALEAVRTFRPLTAAERSALAARTREAALDGSLEQFKTTDQFDATVHHPEWME